ncbi:sugar phosphate isomerase/epimerase family protein [Streptosporangium saharense]|uniref:Myo-inositol catabolism protein IolH n=1 Tax=Streptosporangium saharense TaxID=1706840 RepID=A0A7W7QPQ1_9ACTN|nr:sugar phosphate isomerase/epimerase family protein [Streptosporangium saharense]MBB4917496.1 myo-inositol catabolism protein IolH [Streptosporangium saharense]
MKIATDTWMLRPHPIDTVFSTVREAGFEYLELSPRPDVMPSYGGRRASKAKITEIAQASKAHGVGIVSIFIEQAWGSSEEDIRQAAVSYWKQTIQLAVDLGCDRINSEFTGRPSAPQAGEAAMRRSLEEVLPLAEAEGITLALEPHPGDWLESGIGAVDFIRGLQSDNVTYLHCVPHTYYLTGVEDERGHFEHVNRDIITYAGDTMDHVHLADTLLPGRTFLNPGSPGVRNHQHLDIGQGDIDWDEVFDALREVAFDGVLSVAVFRHESRVTQSLTHNLRIIRERLEGGVDQ